MSPADRCTLDCGNNDVVSLAYDSLTGRLTSITAPSVSLAYLYFPNVNLSRITDDAATDFTNDPLDRLKTAAGEYSASFNYDQIGNITGKTEGGTAYSLNYAGTSHKHAPVSVTLGNNPPDSYTYDANGNLIARSGLALKYDAENRLVKISNASGYVARFIYDGDGKRVKRVDNAGTVIHIGPHYERNVGTGADTTDTVTKMYWAQLGPIRRLIAVRKGTDLTYLHHDHLGSTKKLSTASTPFKYYPYGTMFQEPASPPTDNLYTGQKRDLSTGLYFYGARYYDSAIGRFVQPDSVIPSPGNPQSLNRYSYCVNNPLKYADPTGHFFILVIGLAVVGVAAYEWLSHPSTANAPAAGETTSSSVEWASTRAGLASAPGTGDVNDVVSFVTGKDQLTGEVLNSRDRAMTGAAAMLPLVAGPVLRRGANVGEVVWDAATDIPMTAFKSLKGLAQQGLERHHILEQRFARVLDEKVRDMLSIATESEAHDRITREWRRAIGYVGDSNPLNTATATIEDVVREARRIYSNLPEIIDRLNEHFPQ